MDRAPVRPPSGRDRLRRLLDAALAGVPYSSVLLTGTLLLDARPPAERGRWLDYAGTDLANLADHPVRSMVLSACFAEGDLVGWVVLALVGLGALGLRWGAWRPLALAFTVHVLATGVSQGITAIRIASGDLPESARVMRDVGASYLVVAALVAAVGYGTVVGRVLGACGFAVLVPTLFEGLTSLDVAAVGHTVSIGLALLLGRLFLRPAHPGPVPDVAPGVTGAR